MSRLAQSYRGTQNGFVALFTHEVHPDSLGCRSSFNSDGPSPLYILRQA